MPWRRQLLQQPVVRTNLARRLTLAALLIVLGCSGAADRGEAWLDPLSGIQAPTRVVVSSAWDTLFVIGGSAEDTLLLMPRTLAASRGLIVAYDYGDDRIKAFDDNGRLIWVSGGTGSGPGEFRGNFGLQIDTRGTVWAADPELARLTALDDTGGVAELVPLTVQRLAGLALVEDRPFAVLSGPDVTLLGLGSDGAPSIQVPPLPVLRELPDFARSVVVASNGGGVWAMAYPYGNLLVVYDGMDVRCTGKLISGQSFPLQPIREPVFSVSAIALQDSLVVVLANGGGDDRNRHIDRYALEDCRYRDSFELPSRFAALAYDGTAFVLEQHDPAPAILRLRTVPQQ